MANYSQIIESVLGRVRLILDNTFPESDYPNFARPTIWNGNVADLSLDHQVTTYVACENISNPAIGPYFLLPGYTRPNTPLADHAKKVTCEVSIKMVHTMRHPTEDHPSSTMLAIIDAMVIGALASEILATPNDEDDDHVLCMVEPGIFEYCEKEYENETYVASYGFTYDLVIPPPSYVAEDPTQYTTVVITSEICPEDTVITI